MNVFANTLLLCVGFGLIMERTRLANQASWDDCARLIGISSPDAYTRRALVVIAGLALVSRSLVGLLA